MGKASREKQRQREAERHAHVVGLAKSEAEVGSALADTVRLETAEFVRPPTGHITWSGGGAATERMAYWLPPGVTPADIGLQSIGRLNVARAVIADGPITVPAFLEETRS